MEHAARRGFRVVAAALGVTMVGTTLPTPLYPALQHRLGFDDLTVTVLFASYAIGVLAALVLLGRISDVIGRRPVLLAALACAALSALAFLAWPGVTGLLIGRVLSGLSAGMIAGTATAALVELEPEGDQAHAGLVATAVNMLGLGCGPLLSGLLAAFGPAPLIAPFAVHLALVVLTAVGVWFVPQSRRPGSGTRLRIDWPTLPREVRPIFPAVSAVMFACFAMFGLVAAIEPAFLAKLLHVSSPALSGGVVFGMFAGSAVSQVATRRLPAPAALTAGCAGAIAAVCGFALALVSGSVAALVIATVAVGLGHGVAFRAAVALIGARSPVDQRGGTMSSFFVVVYLGISAPVVAAGRAAGIWGLRVAGIGFTAVVALLLLLALGVLLRANAR
ncbi:MFS transporter [Nocardia panacis]|uniref:MFS transporter n=1 Tax=Nocardia panacis TaxID=2340916 RepID=A0A3A4KEW6_9NOCA|nr:MFS transporter [Nocardia panacis]